MSVLFRAKDHSNFPQALVDAIAILSTVQAHVPLAQRLAKRKLEVLPERLSTARINDRSSDTESIVGLDQERFPGLRQGLFNKANSDESTSSLWSGARLRMFMGLWDLADVARRV